MRCVALSILALTGCELYFGHDTTPPDGGSTAQLVVAGGRSTCARRDGVWWCWGANYADQIMFADLGDQGPRLTPVQIAATSKVLAIGAEHMCAASDGEV